MLDHMTFRVVGIARTRAFCGAALGALGYREGHFGSHGDETVLGYALDGPFDAGFIAGPSPWQGPPATTGAHRCWRAKSRAEVDAFHAAALAAGGRDNGPPGLRPHDHPHDHAHCDGAFVIDPDGNNVEAVCHEAA